MNDFPTLTNAVLGTKFKIVPGYALDATDEPGASSAAWRPRGVAGFGMVRAQRPGTAMDHREEDQKMIAQLRFHAQPHPA